jgi:hypothetical protein
MVCLLLEWNQIESHGVVVSDEPYISTAHDRRVGNIGRMIIDKENWSERTYHSNTLSTIHMDSSVLKPGHLSGLTPCAAAQ